MVNAKAVSTMSAVPDSPVASAVRQSDALSREDMAEILAVTRALAAPFDLKTMLASVTDAACHVLRAERASIWMHDAAADQLVLEVSSDLQAVRVPVGSGLVGTCARTGEAIIVPDCYADPRFDAAVDRRSGFRTRCALTLPLIDHRGTLVGALQVLNREGGVFEVADLPLAQALAAQCAVALSRVRMTEAAIEAERLHRELEVARTVQMGALPLQLPEVLGYDIHRTFMPADLTGGDTYDVARTEQGVLLVIGDASGHGVAPALMVTQMHAMLRMALRLGADLETAFGHVNDQLAATYLDGRFVTAFIGLLDEREHRLRYLSAGQAPILQYRAATGGCVRYGATSFPMGAMPLSRPVPARDIEFAPGDIVALVTDGVYETANRCGVLLGVEAIERTLRAHARDSAAGLACHVLGQVNAFADGLPQNDDITMVLVKRQALP